MLNGGVSETLDLLSPFLMCKMKLIGDLPSYHNHAIRPYRTFISLLPKINHVRTGSVACRDKAPKFLWILTRWIEWIVNASRMYFPLSNILHRERLLAYYFILFVNWFNLVIGHIPDRSLIVGFQFSKIPARITLTCCVSVVCTSPG